MKLTKGISAYGWTLETVEQRKINLQGYCKVCTDLSTVKFTITTAGDENNGWLYI